MITSMNKFIGLILTVLMLSACSSTNDVVNNSLFQKRKHRSGFHFSGLAQKGTQHSAEIKSTAFEKGTTMPRKEFADRKESHEFMEKSVDSAPLELVSVNKQEMRKSVSSVLREIKGGKADIDDSKESRDRKSVV